MSVRVQMAATQQQQQSPAVAVRIPDRSNRDNRFPGGAASQMMLIANSDHSSVGGGGGGPPGGHHGRPRNFPPYKPYPRHPPVPDTTGSTEYDGRRLRKSLVRKTVDYNAAIIKGLQNRVWQRDYGDRRALEPDYSYAPDTVPPSMLLDNPTNAVTTRYVKSATNKMRCPIFSMAWTPEGRRLITGASSGEFTLWNGLTFNFETILQAHDSPVRSMIWSHNDVWMVTGDHAGYVKYWQSNMNNVKMFQAHKEAIRGLTFSPSDQKFASCSDDGTVRVWDFYTCYEEKVLRGHGADVKCVDWHPHKSIIVSGSKDNQQPVKIWDAKSGIPLATLHAHKSTVMDARWNKNGNWLVTASRDHLVKLFDIRKLSQEFQVFRGHKKEASCVSWHPIHEELFVSGGSDGSILFWNVGCDKEVGSIEAAHDNIIWSLAWHPVGHILCSGSNDHTSKFWTRQKPGDVIRDRTHGGPNFDYSQMEDNEMEEIIPGMGPEDKIDTQEEEPETVTELVIPGLDITEAEQSTKLEKQTVKKTPYQKPIPKKFQAIWNDAKVEEELDDEKDKIRNTLLPKPGEHTANANAGKAAQQQQQPTNANGSGINARNNDSSAGGMSNMGQQQQQQTQQQQQQQQQGHQPSQSSANANFGVFNPNVGFGPMDLNQYGINSNQISGGSQRGPPNQSMFQQSGPSGPSPFLNPSPNPFWQPNPAPPPPPNMNRMPPPGIGGRGRGMNRMMIPRNPPPGNNNTGGGSGSGGGGGWNR